MFCKNRLERKGGKFIPERRCHGIVIRSQWSGGLTREEQRARKGNWVTVLDAIVNKEMTRERRCRVWFIRSFKGVMWHAVGNWLSLKEPPRETERGRVCREYVCLWVSSIPNTHAGSLFLHMLLYKYLPGSSKAFYFPSGGKKKSQHSPPTTSTLLCATPTE